MNWTKTVIKGWTKRKGVSCFPFDYTMCKFITDLFFTNVGLASVNRLFTSEADNSFQEWHRKENVWIIMLFSRIPLCLLHLSTCLTGWVHDQELGLYWLNRVEAPLLNQIPCRCLICAASADFICWNCAFDIVICLLLDLDSMSAQFFQTRLQ